MWERPPCPPGSGWSDGCWASRWTRTAIRATHEGIGQAVGLSRVTVSRTLGELAAQGAVALSYRSVMLLDREALAGLAFEPQ